MAVETTNTLPVVPTVALTAVQIPASFSILAASSSSTEADVGPCPERSVDAIPRIVEILPSGWRSSISRVGWKPRAGVMTSTPKRRCSGREEKSCHWRAMISAASSSFWRNTRCRVPGRSSMSAIW